MWIKQRAKYRILWDVNSEGMGRENWAVKTKQESQTRECMTTKAKKKEFKKN